MMPDKACGSSYAWMLVTESGATPSKPWEWYAGPIDYDEWRDVAYRVQKEVFRKWNYLLATEEKLQQFAEANPGELTISGPYPEREQLLFLLQEFDKEIKKVPHVLVELATGVTRWTWEPSIRQAISAGRDGTCVLELLDAAMAYYQEDPLPTTQPPRKPGSGDETDKSESDSGGIGGALVTLLGAGVGIYLWRRHKKKRAA